MANPVQQLLLYVENHRNFSRNINNNNINNNNANNIHVNHLNNPALWRMRDRLFRLIVERGTITYAQTFTTEVQKVMEYMWLCFALICLFITLYCHIAFVRHPMTCLEAGAENWTRQGILRVELILNDMPPIVLDTPKNYDEERVARMSNVKRNLDVMNRPKKQIKNIVIVPEELRDEIDETKIPEFTNRTAEFLDSVDDFGCMDHFKDPLNEKEMANNLVYPQVKHVLEYALEYGYLRISDEGRRGVTLNIHSIAIDPNDACFGNDLSKFMLSSLVGYDDVLMLSLRHVVEKHELGGYVRNVVTGDQYRFVDSALNWTAYISAAFFMMLFTLCVSMLLRFSHHQIFMFVVELLNMFEVARVATFPVAPLLTVILALVGMEAIMSEFFNDAVTAFYVIVIVWIADQFYSICCRTPTSQKHWLKFFYLYHYGFYAYQYRFDGYFSAMALVTSWCFTLHSMHYFFHKFELPEILGSLPPENDHIDEDSDSDSSNQGDIQPSAEESTEPNEDDDEELQQQERQGRDYIRNVCLGYRYRSSSASREDEVRERSIPARISFTEWRRVRLLAMGLEAPPEPQPPQRTRKYSG